VGHGTRGTAEHVGTAPGGCVWCAHATRYGNCGEPVAAGLLERFGLVRHPDGGRGCPAFTRPPSELEARAALLLVAGAIEPADLELLRERQGAHQAGEWSQLLSWCEAAARDAALAGEIGPSCRDRGGADTSPADSEERASGPTSHACSSTEVRC
jgi:hypothetical protein